jgi:hypothetical protein
MVSKPVSPPVMPFQSSMASIRDKVTFSEMNLFVQVPISFQGKKSDQAFAPYLLDAPSPDSIKFEEILQF